MKKLMSIFLLSSAFFLIVSCANQENSQVVQVLKKTDTEIKQEKLLISQILDNLAAANESGNFEMIKNTWLQSEDVLLVGTEDDEKLEGWEEIKAAVKKQFSSFNETLISITDQSIWMNEDATVSWFFEELNYNFVYEGKAMTFKGIRFTGVMLKVDGQWKMVQQHMSIPAHLQMVELHQ